MAGLPGGGCVRIHIHIELLQTVFLLFEAQHMFPIKDGAVRWLTSGVVNRATQISVSSWLARDLPTSGSRSDWCNGKGKSRLVKYDSIWPDVIWMSPLPGPRMGWCKFEGLIVGIPRI